MKSHKIKNFLLLSVILGLMLISLQNLATNASPQVTSFHYEKSWLNGHPGYITEWRIAGAFDKPIIVVLGYDPSNDYSVYDAISMYGSLIDQMNAEGYDIIVFDYVDGDTWIQDNADNLADFIRYVDSYFSGDYTLALIGASMGGIVGRTMFAQEGSNMGVDIFITLDSPHYGVYFSNYVSWLTGALVDFFLLTPAGQQMYHGSDLYNQFYGWLQSVENSQFLNDVIGPMTTAAYAMSNGEGRWSVSWGSLATHTKYHPVSSYTKIGWFASDFIPYHSAVYLDDPSTSSSLGWFKTYYWYRNTHSTYFDYKFPTYRTEHTASNFGYLLSQAMGFVKTHW